VSAAIDGAAFAALQDSAGKDFVAELVGTFLEEAPGMLGELHAALHAGEPERFRRAAHSLKSNGLTFGALDFAAIAKRLELAGLEGARSAAAPDVGALDEEYARVAAALEALRRA
jgi:HPt (histidine-containing phosphotransfer) domain-containing protein